MPQITIPFDNFFLSAPFGMTLLDSSGKVNRANIRFCNLLQTTEAELHAKSLESYICPDDLTTYQQSIKNNLLSEFSEHNLELRFIRLDGVTIWGRLSVSAFSDQTGQLFTLISIEDLTSVKTLQDTLQINDARMKRIVEAASIGIYDWNLQTNETYWNDSNYTLLNVKKDGNPPNFQSVLAKLPDSVQEKARQKMQTMIEQGGVYEYEYPIQQEDGSYRHILSRSKVTERDNDGKPLTVSGVLTDITDLKAAQENARQAKARFNQAMEANLIGVMICQRNGRVLEANRAFLDMLGFSRTELEAGLLNWRTLTPPEYAEVNARNERIVNVTGIMPVSEKQYFHKDGSRVDVILAFTMFEDDPNTGIAFIVDNTQRKQQERALKENEENLRVLADFIPQMVWMANQHGERYWFNQRWYNYTGATLEQVHGWGWQTLIHPDHRERVIAGIKKSWDTGVPWEDSYLLLCKDGVYYWFLSRAQPVRNERGDIIRWFGTSTDISEIHETQEALQRSQRELTTSNHDLEQFAAIASHDLQAPLRKAKYFCDIVLHQAQGQLDDESLDLLSRALNSLDHMQMLISDLLALSKISREPETFERIDLNQILQQVLINLSDTIQETGATIEAQTMVTLYGNEIQLTQLLQNLVQNALKYQSPKNRPVILIQAGCNETACKISVQDNGIGFEQEYAERIFKPFERLHGKTSPYTGTGMGLAICQRIVERHRGTIIAHSQPDHGATFLITLPLPPQGPHLPSTQNQSVSGSISGF